MFTNMTHRPLQRGTDQSFPNRRATPRRMIITAPDRGFTLIEVLVVLGVITLLLALLLPVLGGVQSRGRKTQEMNMLRQYGTAWQAYANQNNDSILPGYLPPDVQELWKVTFRYNPDDEISALDIAAPYTWRLMPFMAYNSDMVAGYRDQGWGPMEVVDNAEDVAVQPPFGYNGYLLGGYFEVLDISGQSIARPRYDPADTNIVARRMANLRRTSDQIVFGATVLRDAGVYPMQISDYELGTHLMVPPYLHDEPGETLEQRWWVAMTGIDVGTGDGVASNSELEVFVDDTGVPAGRYTNTTAINFADGHVDSIAPGSQTMLDRRKWVYSGNERTWIDD